MVRPRQSKLHIYGHYTNQPLTHQSQPPWLLVLHTFAHLRALCCCWIKYVQLQCRSCNKRITIFSSKCSTKRSAERKWKQAAQFETFLKIFWQPPAHTFRRIQCSVGKFHETRLDVVSQINKEYCAFRKVGGVAQWLGRRSLAGGLSLICAWSMADMWPLNKRVVRYKSTNQANSAFHPSVNE